MNKTTIFHAVQSDVMGGGIENIFLEYSKILRENNFDLICLVSKNFCHIKELEKNNIKIKFLNITGHFDLLAAIKLHYLIKKYSPELILAHNGRTFATINICKKLFGLGRSKTMAVSHGGNIKRILKFDFIISVAKHIYDKIAKKNFGGSLTNIYNGYEFSEFSKNKISNIFTFGILSRLSKEKGVVDAIKAFKSFNDSVNKNSILIIAGGGDELENIKSLIKNLQLQDKVKLLGWISNKEEFFNQIDVFLQPAKRESFGITILESFNYKTPVVACNADGPKEIIKDSYSGYLFDPDSEESLFLTMKRAYDNKHNHSQIVSNANEDLKNRFSRKIMAKQLIEFVNKGLTYRK
ncbi:MAG: hypothetical protein K0R25_414 [Rickettsiaceae bacterium]|jgi:glycosyltransferase involved in cell wall biosynthesis|nr:hypothetical protein [Rickettsiaceae bacterium]